MEDFLGGRLIKLIGWFSSKPCVIDSQRVKFHFVGCASHFAGDSQYIYTYIVYMYIYICICIYIYIVVLIKCHNIPFISGSTSHGSQSPTGINRWLKHSPLTVTQFTTHWTSHICLKIMQVEEPVSNLEYMGSIWKYRLIGL